MSALIYFWGSILQKSSTSDPNPPSILPCSPPPRRRSTESCWAFGFDIVSCCMTVSAVTLFTPSAVCPPGPIWPVRKPQTVVLYHLHSWFLTLINFLAQHLHLEQLSGFKEINRGQKFACQNEFINDVLGEAIFVAGFVRVDYSCTISICHLKWWLVQGVPRLSSNVREEGPALYN